VTGERGQDLALTVEAGGRGGVARQGEDLDRNVAAVCGLVRPVHDTKTAPPDFDGVGEAVDAEERIRRDAAPTHHFPCPLTRTA
jgi:hypothetical protein